MTNDEYLAAVLKAETLSQGSPELTALQERREEIDTLLLNAFPGCNPTLRYGGSRAKGTMNKSDYDLDIICYFPHDEDRAGATLEEIYNNARDALGKQYAVQEKTSAIRLYDNDADIHIDVVPGRFTDASKTDSFLFQRSGDKMRLKTNLDVHISHISNSGVREPIRLSKLWRYLNSVQVRTFPLELMVIELLKAKRSASISAQIEHVLTAFRDSIDDIRIEDPANPTGNDLTHLLDSTTRSHTSTIARSTLQAVKMYGWQHVFGAVEQATSVNSIAGLSAVAAQVPRTRPWASN